MRTCEDTQTQQGNENKTKQQYIFIRIATVIKKQKRRKKRKEGEIERAEESKQEGKKERKKRFGMSVGDRWYSYTVLLQSINK